VAVTQRSVRRPRFAEEVLRAYAYQCAVCGFDGALGRNPVGIEAAHVRWHSQAGPDVVANGLALCALHHALFDLGVLGLTAERRIRVSDPYVARSEAGRGVVLLAGRSLIALCPASLSWSLITSAGMADRSSRQPPPKPRGAASPNR